MAHSKSGSTRRHEDIWGYIERALGRHDVGPKQRVRTRELWTWVSAQLPLRPDDLSDTLSWAAMEGYATYYNQPGDFIINEMALTELGYQRVMKVSHLFRDADSAR